MAFWTFVLGMLATAWEGTKTAATAIAMQYKVLAAAVLVDLMTVGLVYARSGEFEALMVANAIVFSCFAFPKVSFQWGGTSTPTK
jgi:hypothetical protein